MPAMGSAYLEHHLGEKHGREEETAGAMGLRIRCKRIVHGHENAGRHDANEDELTEAHKPYTVVC